MVKTNKIKDTELVERVQQGDTSAFRGLVEKYKDVSFSLACSVIKDESLAEDVLQDAFIKAFRNIHKFRGKSSFSTWLYRIVVNACYDEHRRKKKSIYSGLDEAEMLEADNRSDNDSIFHRDRSRYITDALKRMKPDEALILRLYYLCELGLSEIKEITGFGESKIKVALHRGRQNMAAILENMLGNEVNQLL